MGFLGQMRAQRVGVSAPRVISSVSGWLDVLGTTSKDAQVGNDANQFVVHPSSSTFGCGTPRGMSSCWVEWRVAVTAKVEVGVVVQVLGGVAQGANRR